MKRRSFFKYSGVVLGSTSLLGGCQFSEQQNKQALKCFIVSDAHIGWDGKEQPSVEKQKKLVRHIVQQFPDLDLAFDTGDAHHGSLNEEQRIQARTQWLDAIAHQFSLVPFHYIVGNHELGKGESDPEKVACALGSMALRPYYAFDSHGIHFVSLPELFDTILITRETLNWLALDLMFNKNKTTIILSHNSIKGTTYYNGATGYRCLVNSEEVKQLLAQHPQVVAWLHGHNHQYEIVDIGQQVHVSNGRIGGFDPPMNWGPFGQGHLGGIYFEISRNALTIKAYSASKGQMLSELGFPHLQLQKSINTSFDPGQDFNYYFGHGMTTDGMRHQVHQHYLGTEDRQLLWQKQSGPVNENADLQFPTKYEFVGKQQIRMLGYKFNSNDIIYATTAGHLEVSNPKHLEEYALMFPNHINRKTQWLRRGSYYVCEDGQKYQLRVELSDLDFSTANLSLEVDVYVMPYQTVTKMTLSPSQIAGQYVIFDITVDTQGAANDESLYLRFNLHFKQFPEQFTIRSIGLYPASEAQSDQAVLTHCSGTSQIMTSEGSGLVRLDACQKAESEWRFSGLGRGLIAWLVQVRDIQWQVRNAVATFSGNKLTVKQRRYSPEIHHDHTIVLTPTRSLQFYLNQLLFVEQAEIHYNMHQIEIRLPDYSAQTRLLFVCQNEPESVSGAKIEAYSNGVLTLQPTSNLIGVGMAA